MLRRAAGCWKPRKDRCTLSTLRQIAGQQLAWGSQPTFRGGSDKEKALLLAIVAGFGVVGTVYTKRAAACAGPVARTPYPPRPQAYILRPDTDPRLDASVLVRFDPPEHLRTGASIIVMPGGNYESCCWTKEGQQVAAWLANMGVTAFVLRYRLLPEGHYWPAQLEDYEDAVSMIRKNSTAWRLDKARVGVIGFSAGGHLAAMAALSKDESTRPNLQILVYPSIDTSKPVWWPWCVWEGFPAPEESPHLHVTADTPPAFLVVSTKDGLCTAEDNTVPFEAKLREAGVEVGGHIIEDMGRHGHGLKPEWSAPCRAWLASKGWVSADDAV